TICVLGCFLLSYSRRNTEMTSATISQTPLTESLIRRMSDEKSFSRGKAYFQDGCVHSVVYRGNTVTAMVEGTEMYRVTARFDPDGEISVTCSCPYDWGGWCKHIVAALLACVRTPEEVDARP